MNCEVNYDGSFSPKLSMRCTFNKCSNDVNEPQNDLFKNYHKTKVGVIISKADFSPVKTYWIY